MARTFYAIILDENDSAHEIYPIELRCNSISRCASFDGPANAEIEIVRMGTGITHGVTHRIISRFVIIVL